MKVNVKPYCGTRLCFQVYENANRKITVFKVNELQVAI